MTAELLMFLLLAAAPPDAAAAKPADLAALAWMEGHWVSDPGDGSLSEEIWTSPAGGLLLGLHRDVRGSRAFFEYLRIEARGDGIVYIASPGGAPPTEFRMASRTSASVTFRNPAHDFPQTITYAREENRMCARVEGPSTDGTRTEEWCWNLREQR